VAGRGQRGDGQDDDDDDDGIAGREAVGERVCDAALGGHRDDRTGYGVRSGGEDEHGARRTDNSTDAPRRTAVVGRGARGPWRGLDRGSRPPRRARPITRIPAPLSTRTCRRHARPPPLITAGQRGAGMAFRHLVQCGEPRSGSALRRASREARTASPDTTSMPNRSTRSGRLTTFARAAVLQKPTTGGAPERGCTFPSTGRRCQCHAVGCRVWPVPGHDCMSISGLRPDPWTST
jgi:hypothetical protein